VSDQVRDKLFYPFEDMGEQCVKNIARPVRAYALGAQSPTPPVQARILVSQPVSYVPGQGLGDTGSTGSQRQRAA
jgi:hypothetical protein